MVSRTRASYAYIVARTKVMKSRLLKADDFRKLLNMSFEEIVRFLEETEYKREIDEMAYKYSGPRLLDYALYMNMARTYKKILQVSFGEARRYVAEYLRRWDVWNLINIIRGKTANVEPEIIEETLVPAGEFTEEFLKTLLVKDVEEIIKELEGTPYYEALSKFGTTSLSTIEDELYKIYYRRLLEIQAREFAERLFLNFIKMEIDIKNIKTILRLKLEDATPDEILDRIIPGGYELTEDEVRKLVAMPFDELVKAVEGYWFWKGIEKLEDLSRIEVNFDKVWIETIAKRASNYPLSILPVLQYVVLKKVEVDNLRIIGWGKWYEMPNEEIERQLVIV